MIKQKLVVYTKGNRGAMERKNGKGHHFINTTRQDLHEVLGMRYKEIIFEEGVSEEDINFVKKFNLDKKPNIVSVTLDAPIELTREDG